MTQKRPAFVLVEMLAVLFVVAAGLSLVTAGLHSIRYAQRRIADSANRTALTDDFLRCLTDDIRHATSAHVESGDAEGGYTELALEGTSPRVTYRFFGDRVERAASPRGTLAPKQWAPITATVSASGDDGAAHTNLVSATVLWHMTDRYDPRADRRFDVAVRCVGERYHDVD